MDQRELVEITFRLPLTALGQLSSLLEAAGQAMTQEERTESGQGTSFDEAQFEAVQAAEPELSGERSGAVSDPELSRGREMAAVEPELGEAAVEWEEPALPERRRMEGTEPELLEEIVRPSQEVELGESVRQERDVSVRRLFQGTVETLQTPGTPERTAAEVNPRVLSALWERDARRYDGGFSLK